MMVSQDNGKAGKYLPHGAHKRPLIMDLEQRLMFDGTALTEAVNHAAFSFSSVASSESVDTQAQTPSKTPASPRREVVFIDSSISGYQVLLEEVPPEKEWVIPGRHPGRLGANGSLGPEPRRL